MKARDIFKQPRILRVRTTGAPPAAACVFGLALAFLAGGCGGRGAEQDPALEGVPVSAELRRALEADAAPAAAAAEAPFAADLALYDQLTVDIQRPTTRTAAGDTLYAVWRRDPTNFLWINHGAGYNYLLRRRDDRNAMYALPALADTATAVGAYLQGRRFYGYGSDGEPYERAWERREDLDALQRAWLARSVAEVRADAGDPVAAVRLLLQELPAARAAGGGRLAADYWHHVALRLAVGDRLDDALHAAVRAEREAAACGAQYLLLQCRRVHAHVLAARQESEAARMLYTEIVAEARSYGYSWLVVSGLGELASLHAAEGNLRGALAADLANVAWCLDVADSINAPRALMNAAHDQLMLGQPDSCLVLQQHARSIIESFDDRRNLAALPFAQAEYFLQVGDYVTADSLLALASQRADGSGLALDEAEILVSQVRGAVEAWQPDVAYRALARLDQLSPVLNDMAVHQNFRADFGLVTADFLGRQGEYARAASALGVASEAVADQGGEGMRFAYHRSAGDLASRRGDHAGAAQAYAAALAVADSSGAKLQFAQARLDLARSHVNRGAPDEAATLLRGAHTGGAFGEEFSARLESRSVLGSALRLQGDLTASEAVLRAALDLVTGRTPIETAARLNLEAALTLSARGARDDAGGHLDRAVALISDAGDGRTDPALQRDVFEACCAHFLDQSPGAGSRGAARRALDTAGRLGIRFPPDAGTSSQAAYFLGRSRSFCWAWGDGGVTMHSLPNATEIERLVQPVLAEYQAIHREPDWQAARRLADVVLAPVMPVWHDGGELRIAPDGVLSLVPWAAMPLPGARGEGPIPDLAVDRGPVVMLCVVDAPPDGGARPGGANLLALGCDGTADAGAGPVLRNAEREARRVAAVWSEGGVDLRVGARAAWSASLAEDLASFDVIHIASHAVIHRGDPSGGVLRLAGPAGAAPVTIAAVRGLSLRAGLVYLSCCEAAGARADAAAGTDDFAGAFLQAGARTVVASPLRIDDEHAEKLAMAFYRHWQPAGDPGAALRQAMLEVRADAASEHPGVWSFLRVCVPLAGASRTP